MNLATARLYALKKMPYMASLLYTLKPVEKPDLPTTMAVAADGTLYWNPEMCESIGFQKTGGELLHECMHLLRRHPKRRHAYRPEDNTRWNVAADLEIDDDLKAAHVEMFEGGVDHKKMGVPTGKTAEWYYVHLERQDEDEENKPHVCFGGCAEGKDDEDGNPQKGEGPKLSLAIETAIEQVAKAIEKQVKEKGQGSVPLGLRKLADVLNGKLNWRQLLRRYVGGALGRPEAVDLTFRRINRRQGGLGFGEGRPVLYGYHNPQPKVCVAIDTSGSMYYGKELDQCLGELAKILSVVGGQVFVITGDAKVHAQQNIKSVAEARKLIGGGGGTDFRPLFKAAEKTKADLFVYLTDGCGDAPTKAPRFPVVWCLIGNYTQQPTTWGKYVKIESEEKSDNDSNW